MKAVWKATWILHCARRQVSTHRPIAFAATAAFCLLTLVLGGAVLGKRTAGRWGELVGQNIHVIVYLADDVDRDQIGRASCRERV